MLKALSRRLTRWLNQVLLYLRLLLDLSERIRIVAPNTHFKKNACYLLVRDHSHTQKETHDIQILGIQFIMD